MYMYSEGRHRDLGVEERLDDLQGKIRELEKQNATLKSKVRVYNFYYVHVHVYVHCTCIHVYTMYM